MLNWNVPTSLPLNLAGAISAMYIGPNTDDPPIASPPMNRANTNEPQFQANAHPIAESRYRIASMRRLARRPYLSPGYPAIIDPITVPQSALDTVRPSVPGVRPKTSVRARVAPAITAVSKPNRRPPRAATIVALSKYGFMVEALISITIRIRSV